MEMVVSRKVTGKSQKKKILNNSRNESMLHNEGLSNDKTTNSKNIRETTS